MASDVRTVGRSATIEDVPIVAACLASAFYHDPLWGHWAFPDQPRRQRDLLAFMTLMAQLGCEEMWTAITPGGESVTLWTLPGVIHEASGHEALIGDVFDDLFGERALALHALFEQFGELTPTGHFYHLEWWATRRDRAGRGFGGALIRENLARVDAEHLPSYLESTNPVNLPRYEALGFRRVGEFGPPDGPTVTTMWREAR